MRPNSVYSECSVVNSRKATTEYTEHTEKGETDGEGKLLFEGESVPFRHSGRGFRFT